MKGEGEKRRDTEIKERDGKGGSKCIRKERTKTRLNKGPRKSKEVKRQTEEMEVRRKNARNKERYREGQN